MNVVFSLRSGLHRNRLARFSKEVKMGFIVWIVVGLIAGWLAGQVMKGGAMELSLTLFLASSAAS